MVNSPEQPLGWCPQNPEQYGALVHGTTPKNAETAYTPEKIEEIEQNAAREAGVEYPREINGQYRFKLHMFLDRDL